MSKEQDPLLIKDHEYDGIQELDNHLPNWWLWTFLISIAFAFLYWIHYTVTESGPSLDQELQQALVSIEKQREKQDVAPGEQSNIDWVAMGGKVYKNYCASCHGAEGGGGIGPNLTDSYWIHGKGDSEGMDNIIVNGVLDKGMPAWKGLLKPKDVKSVIAFIASLKGSQPANAKEPQGKLVE